MLDERPEQPAYKLIHQVWFRLCALIAVLCVLFSLYLVLNYFADRAQLKKLYDSRIISEQQTFDALLEGEKDQIFSLATDYTHWDDLVSFVNGKAENKSFSSDNLVTALETYEISDIWIYDQAAQPLYYTNGSSEGVKESNTIAPIDNREVKKIFTSNGVRHFFMKTEDGIYEIAAATIHPSSDSARKTPPAGYFIAGRLLEEDWLTGASAALGGNLTIANNIANQADTKYDLGSGRITLTANIFDHNNQPVASFIVNGTSEDLKAADQAMDRKLALGAVLIMTTTAILSSLLIFWVIKPLRRVRSALAKNNPAPVALLKIRSNEFGDISKMISQYFNQQDALLQQKSKVEEEVLARTKELRQEHARLQSTFESINSGLLITYDQTSLAICNPAMAKLLGIGGLDNQQPSGTMAISLDHLSKYFPDYPLEAKAKKCLETNQTFNDAEVVVGSRTYRVFGSPIRIHQTESIGCVILVDDITEQKVLERAKDEFFTIASHELRTPLTAIMGNSSILLEDYNDKLDSPDIAPMLKDIFSSSQKLITIVNNFLDMSALEQGKAELKTTNCTLKDIVDDVVKHFSVISSNQDCEIVAKYDELAQLPQVTTDPKRIQQVLTVLVDNAIVHGHAKQVTIHAGSDKEQAWVSVVDNGNGVPEQNQKMLFHKFQQAGNSLLTRDISGGTGVELYIAKLLVTSLGGNIRLDFSAPDRGTSFSFSIPLSATKAPQVVKED